MLPSSTSSSSCPASFAWWSQPPWCYPHLGRRNSAYIAPGTFDSHFWVGKAKICHKHKEIAFGWKPHWPIIESGIWGWNSLLLFSKQPPPLRQQRQFYYFLMGGSRCKSDTSSEDLTSLELDLFFRKSVGNNDVLIV